MRRRNRGAAVIGLALMALLLQPGASAGAEADQRAMLDRLGIAETRQGADGFDRSAPNAANRDEARAGDAALPDPLRREQGGRIADPETWRREGRPRLAALLEREIYGAVPATAPVIRWRLVREARGEEGGRLVIRRWLEGVAGGDGAGGAGTTIALRLVLPVDAAPVPVMLSFGFPEGFRFPGAPPPGPTPTEQLAARGWGHAILVATSVQADDGGALRDGVIGAAAGGRARDPGDWGVLRAWAWGASRAREALSAMPEVDGTRIGIEGLSRFGKAALVAMAYDEGFAIGFAGSSGAGGAKPFRRDFGERIGNLAASGEYHWFAGNFLRYAGPLDEHDLPVDASDLIALAAPRPMFIGAGNLEEDGWVDPRGSFLAAQAASPAWSLLGARGLVAEEMPAIDTGATAGRLAFRQHSGGHTNGPNWPAFLNFAQRELGTR